MKARAQTKLASKANEEAPRLPLSLGAGISIILHGACAAAIAVAAQWPRRPETLNAPVVAVFIATTFTNPSNAPREAEQVEDRAPSARASPNQEKLREDALTISPLANETLVETPAALMQGIGVGEYSGPGRDTEVAIRGGAAVTADGVARVAHADGVMPDAYARTISAWIERHKRMPDAARYWTGDRVVVVRFVLDRHGRLSRVRLERSSGAAALDAATLALLRRIEPFPQAPPDAAWIRREFEVPVSYSWRER